MALPVSARRRGKAPVASVYPAVSLAEAREHRDDARRRLAAGIDPSTQRKADKRDTAIRDANSFEAVAREWYAKHSKRLEPRSAAKVWRRLLADLFPNLGATPINEIQPPTLLAAVRNVEARGAHDLAHRFPRIAGQVFRYAVATGCCERAPSGDLRGALTPHKVRNQAAVKPEELPELLRAIDSYPSIGDKQTALALKLLRMTFVRMTDLIGATWEEFRDLDGEAPTWEAPAARMK